MPTTNTTKSFPTTAAAARYIARKIEGSMAVRIEVTEDGVVAHETCAPELATHTGFSAIMRRAWPSRPARLYRIVRTNAKSVVVALTPA